MLVEAYVVDRMTTPFLLGNDFQEQYSLSILRRDGRSFLVFVDDSGHAFKIRINQEVLSKIPRHSKHRKSQKLRRRARDAQSRGKVSAIARTVIPPESSILVPVHAHFPESCESLFVERCLRHNGNTDDIYGAADTLVSRQNPGLHVSNFSKAPVIIAAGEVLGTGHDPRSWLDKAHRMSQKLKSQALAHAAFVLHLVDARTATVRSESAVTSKAQRNASGADDPLAEEPVEGGPKTSEVSFENVPSSQLLTEIHVSPDLTLSQRSAIE
ncbi:hypothetical protein BT96DRAFT_893100, partial [Gymnopus androsaceus JB14]